MRVGAESTVSVYLTPMEAEELDLFLGLTFGAMSYEEKLIHATDEKGVPAISRARRKIREALKFDTERRGGVRK